MKKWPYENIYYRIRNNQPYLIGSRCKKCDYVAFPKKEICPACVTKGNMEETDLSRTGKVDTFSVLHVGAPGFPVPYIVGYVKMPEGPRVFSVIQCDNNSVESIEIGTEVELVLSKIRDDDRGDEIMGFQFHSIEKEQEKEQ